MTSHHQTETSVGGEGTRSFTADAIARLVDGELRGDGSVVVRAVAPIDRAGPEDLTFLASPKYATLLAGSRAGALLVTPELADTPGRVGARIVVTQPQEAVLRVLPELYVAPAVVPGIHPTAVLGRGVTLGRDIGIGAYAVVGAGAVLGNRARIGPHCVIGDGVEIGDDCRLFPAVTLYAGSRVGERVLLHAGARIGSDGFGYVYHDGAHQKIPHVGRCIIGDDVEIGANTTIDRGSIDDTVVGSGTKIDNLVQIGHNVRIGRLCLIMAQVGIAGSAHVEDGSILAGQAGLGGHITIGKGARVAGQSGVFGDVPAGESWSGYPARPHRESLRAQAALFRLPSILRRLERLLARGDE